MSWRVGYRNLNTQARLIVQERLLEENANLSNAVEKLNRDVVKVYLSVSKF